MTSISPDRRGGHDALDPSPATIRDMGTAALEWVAAYHDSIRDLPIAPRTSAAALRQRLAEPLPVEGRDFAELLEVFRDVIVPGSRHNGHPRFFGYVSAPGTAVASVADLLASALNANLPAWRSAPAPVELEHVAIDWIKEALGCDPGARGLFMSGGSMANLAALAAARHRHCGDAVAEQGAAAHPAPLRLYVSGETHHSIHKAAALLGIGRANVREVAVDEHRRMDVEDLVRRIEQDRAAGAEPFFVVATAGTVSTGAVDPLSEIAEVARRYGLWMHVDACYGGFARLAPSARPLFDGLAEADSISLDPHKWLYLPADCGCLIYRDPETARAAFSLDAEYIRVTQTEPAEAFAFWDYGPDLSRRFRALKVWMLLAHAGARAIGEAIESNLDCARHVADLVEASDDFEMLTPVGLSIFCFRYLPPSARTATTRTADEEEIDRLNERILVALQQAGSSYLSNASIDGRFALRGCVVNYRTTRADMEVLLDDVRRAAKQVAGDAG
ncbi:pyridoxal phosphate-dependent decarboxylase family protein [Micromonospora costi]|uniref:Aminotransferase class V-fold PLP-dependent enzyme n=1 Tax=Micromonospora costi TaxID=1530042 RepID=A0A3A9ZYQ8_9ACTN|nr:aminotransferase class I/II-fold pyridoxal phosphate-dependent enzyme [Micromonospora costi]RKN52227.1 aminotransferase class V-fold PLP-dependent enzyme [Micromonospora costi]